MAKCEQMTHLSQMYRLIWIPLGSNLNVRMYIKIQTIWVAYITAVFSVWQLHQTRCVSFELFIK